MPWVLDRIAGTQCIWYAAWPSSVVCLCVYGSRSWTLQKRLNRSRCRLQADSCGPKEPCFRWRSTSDESICMRKMWQIRRCSFLPNYFIHLLFKKSYLSSFFPSPVLSGRLSWLPVSFSAHAKHFLSQFVSFSFKFIYCVQEVHVIVESFSTYLPNFVPLAWTCAKWVT